MIIKSPNLPNPNNTSNKPFLSNLIHLRPNSTFSVALKKNTVSETIPEVLEEIERWGDEGYFSEKNFKKIKKGMIKNFKIQYDQMDLFSTILLALTIKAGPLYLKN